MKKQLKGEAGKTRGKFFYLLLGLLAIFVLVPTLIVLLLAQRMLHTSHDNLHNLLATVQETQLDVIQESNPGRNHETQLAKLREYSFLEELGQQSSLEGEEFIAQAEQLLQSMTPESSYGTVSTYLHFTKSNYLIDLNYPGQNAVNLVSPDLFVGYQGIDFEDTSFARSFLSGGTYQSEKSSTLYTAVVFPNVVFIFNIDFSDYRSRADLQLSENLTADLQDVEFCYYDSYGNARSAADEHELSYLYSFSTLGPDSNHYFFFTHNGHHYICNYTYNEFTQTKFAVFCRDESAENQQVMSTLLWITWVVLLLTGLACAILYARRAYAPIDSLISRLHRDEKKGDFQWRDDFQVLNEAVNSIDDQLNRKDHLLRRFYLLHLLRGQTTVNLEEYREETWLSDQDQPYFAVAVLHIDEVTQTVPLDVGQLEEKVMDFFLQEKLELRSVTESSLLYLLFRLPQTMSDEELLQAARRMHQSLNNEGLSVYLSAIRHSEREIPLCYNEAMELWENYMAREIIGVVANFESLPPHRNRETGLPAYNLIRLLSEKIAALAVDEALQTLDSLTEPLNKKRSDWSVTENMLYDILVYSISLAFYDISIPGDIGKSLIQQCVSMIRTASDVGQLRKQLEECLMLLAGKTDSQDLKKRRFDEIRRYVQKNYMNQNLDSASVSELFHISPSTLTRLFKVYNNTGFLEYIHHLRVDKASQLLESTDYSVAEIAGMVGYTNAVTMNRAFKTYLKTTPGMLRKRS